MRLCHSILTDSLAGQITSHIEPSQKEGRPIDAPDQGEVKCYPVRFIDEPAAVNSFDYAGPNGTKFPRTNICVARKHIFAQVTNPPDSRWFYQL